MRILLVEDHRSLSELIKEHLERSGLDVDAVSSAEDAIHYWRSTRYDGVVLDLGLPDGDGMGVLATLARGESEHSAPVVILTARDDLDSRLRGLNGGADDYLTKPFDMLELEARLRVIMRRPGLRKADIVSFGDLTYDVSRWEAKAGERSIDLAKKEFALLEELMRAAPGIVVKDRLEDRVYAFEPVTANAIEAIVYRVRRKLAAAGSTVRVETVRGIGYRMVLGADDAAVR